MIGLQNVPQLLVTIGKHFVGEDASMLFDRREDSLLAVSLFRRCVEVLADFLERRLPLCGDAFGEKLHLREMSEDVAKLVVRELLSHVFGKALHGVDRKSDVMDRGKRVHHIEHGTLHDLDQQRITTRVELFLENRFHV